MNKAKRTEIFTRLREANPTPTTELNYTSPFELLIAVILSAQATDVGVNKATAKLYPVANTPEEILSLGVEGLKEYIKTIGLFNSKAENVIKTCRALIEKHGGEVPDNREDARRTVGAIRSGRPGGAARQFVSILAPLHRLRLLRGRARRVVHVDGRRLDRRWHR